MRVIALIPVYNEELFVQPLIEHLVQQGVEAYFIDNQSTDNTREILEKYIGRGVVGIETLARDGGFDLSEILNRMEELALDLDADWFIKMDADEFRLPPDSKQTLAEALEEDDKNGYNAVNFIDFMFLPTKESPEHRHPNFQETMRWYYPFVAKFPNRLTAWKRQPQRVSLVHEAGHQVGFPGLRASPRQYRMRHYHFLNLDHAIERHVGVRLPQKAIERGWHGWRQSIRAEMVALPPEDLLSVYTAADEMDPSNAWVVQYIGALATSGVDETKHLAEGESPLVPIIFDSLPKGSSASAESNCESGADLLVSMLGNHSTLTVTPDIDFIAGVISEMQSFHYPAEPFVDSLSHHIRWSDFRIQPEEFKEELTTHRPYLLSDAFRRLFDLSASKAGKSRWGGRFYEPNEHGLNCEQLKAIFPEARFIFVKGASGIESHHCESWQHFMGLSSEELSANPDQTLKKVCEFIKLPFEQAMLKNHRKSLWSRLFGNMFAPKT